MVLYLILLSAGDTLGASMGILQEEVERLGWDALVQEKERLALEKSVLAKLVPLPVDDFLADIPLQDFVGYASPDGEESPAVFENSNTRLYRDYMIELGITGKERLVVDGVIHHLAFPWYAGRPLGVYPTWGLITALTIKLRESFFRRSFVFLLQLVG